MRWFNKWYCRYRYWKFLKKTTSPLELINDLEYLIDNSKSINILNYDDVDSNFSSYGKLIGAYRALLAYVSYEKDPVYEREPLTRDYYYYDWMMDQEGYEVTYAIACKRVKSLLGKLVKNSNEIDWEVINRSHRVILESTRLLIDIGYRKLYL